jgi:hypothetical protein
MLLVEREAQNRSKLQMFYEGLCKTLLESHLSDGTTCWSRVKRVS